MTHAARGLGDRMLGDRISQMLPWRGEMAVPMLMAIMQRFSTRRSPRTTENHGGKDLALRAKLSASSVVLGLLRVQSCRTVVSLRAGWDGVGRLAANGSLRFYPEEGVVADFAGHFLRFCPGGIANAQIGVAVRSLRTISEALGERIACYRQRRGK